MSGVLGPQSPYLHTGLPITSLSSPMAQSCLPTLERFSGTSFSAIRIVLHSCESFSKQAWGRERREQGRREGRLEANLALPPLPHLFPLSTPSCTREPLTRSVLEEVSGQTVPWTCYVTLGKTLALCQPRENNPEGPLLQDA